jgi:hypothetical protein
MRISITFASMKDIKKRIQAMVGLLKRLLGFNEKITSEKTSSEAADSGNVGINLKTHHPYVLCAFFVVE